MITFGVPKQREAKLDKYPDTAVITIMALAGEGKGVGRKIAFNKKALEVMGLVPGISNINFAFDDSDSKVFVAKHDGDDSVRLNKNYSISNKRLYDAITKTYDLDNAVDHEYSLGTSINVNGFDIYPLEGIPTENKVIEDTTDEVATDEGSAPAENVDAADEVEDTTENNW